MKLLIHSQTSTVLPLKFGTGKMISSHSLPCMLLLKPLFECSCIVILQCGQWPNSKRKYNGISLCRLQSWDVDLPSCFFHISIKQVTLSLGVGGIMDNSYPRQLVPRTTRTWVRVVLGTSCLGYELSWVRVVLGTSCPVYELSWVRVV